MICNLTKITPAYLWCHSAAYKADSFFLHFSFVTDNDLGGLIVSQSALFNKCIVL